MADESGEKLRDRRAQRPTATTSPTGPFAPGGGRGRRGVPARADDEPRAPAAGLLRASATTAARRRCSAFIAVPVREGGERARRAVRRSARRTSRSRRPRKTCSATRSCTCCARCENERVFVQLERSKREHAVLRRASQALGAALTEQAVLEAVLVGRGRDRAVRLRRGHALRPETRTCTACARRSARAPTTCST